MQQYRFSFCGLPIEISMKVPLAFDAESYARAGQPWHNLAVRDAEKNPVRIEVLQGPLPSIYSKARALKHAIVDTKTTWALFRTTSNTWPYLFGFSLNANTGLKIPSVLANKDFSKLRVYLDEATRVLTQDILYPLDEVLFRHCLVQRGGMLLHSASTTIQQQGCLFLGDSGAGKSTIAELIETKIGKNLVLTDDRTAVIRNGKDYQIFGTPWHGTLPRFRVGGVPLRNLFFIEQAPGHAMTLLSPDEAFERLLKVYLGTWWLAEHRTKQIEAIESLVRSPKIRCYRLDFSKDASVADFIDEQLADAGGELRVAKCVGRSRFKSQPR